MGCRASCSSLSQDITICFPPIPSAVCDLVIRKCHYVWGTALEEREGAGHGSNLLILVEGALCPWRV